MTDHAPYRQLACAVLESAVRVVQLGPTARIQNQSPLQAAAEYQDALDFLVYGCRHTADPLAWHYPASMEWIAELDRGELVERIRRGKPCRTTRPRGLGPDPGDGRVTVAEAASRLNRTVSAAYQALCRLEIRRPGGRISLDTVERLRGLFEAREGLGRPRRQGLIRRQPPRVPEEALP